MSASEAVGATDADILRRFEDAAHTPEATRTLGFRLLRVDQAAREVEASFQARREFCNPTGVIQGGFLTAMLDDVMSVAGLVTSGMTHVMPTLEMKTSFLRAAPPDAEQLAGRVVKWGRTIAFTEGELFDGERRLLCKATATALPTPFGGPRP